MIALGEIGKQIGAARKQRKLGQRQVAECAGVSRATMDLLENGRATEIGYSKLVRILAVLGLELRVESVSTERPTLEDLLRENSSND